MKIFRECPFTGEIKSREIDVTPQQMKEWKSGGLIQNVMPHLSPDDREFIMTGMTPETWETNMGEQNNEH